MRHGGEFIDEPLVRAQVGVERRGHRQSRHAENFIRQFAAKLESRHVGRRGGGTENVVE